MIIQPVRIFLALLPLFSSFIPSATSCPTNATLRQVCKCESSFNGILLDCSSPSATDPIDTPLILRTLQENRAQLGLIQELLLRNGTLRQLQPRAFEGLYIKKLDLSSNELENITADSFHGLENVLQILILSHNFLTRFPAQALNNMLVLLQLDLSDNDIEDLQEQDILRGTPKLYDLNLANNRICSIHKQVFDDLKPTIQTLNLGGNCFEKVPASAVRGFKQLLALHLHNNRIEQLEPLQFMNLPSLNLINLARNRIEAVHRQSFLNVPNLRFMYLSDNNITKLEGNEFRTFDNLELLDLTRNRIRAIPSEAFVGMPRLSQLYLGENGIERIEANAFANSSLVILLLPNNELTELRADMFQGLTYLQQFSLKGNKITRIASNTFYQMPSLVVADLSDNLLTNLEPATFLAQLNLFLLDLSRNKIAITPNNAFNRRIVTVVLQENPLVCAERIHVLQNGVAVNVPGAADAVCGGEGVATSPPPDPSLTIPGQSSGQQPRDSGPSVTDVPSFVQETPATDTVLVIQQQTKPPRSNLTTNLGRPIVSVNSTVPNTFGLPFGNVDQNIGNPLIGLPNLGNGNFGGSNLAGSGFGVNFGGRSNGAGGTPNIRPGVGPVIGNPGVRSPNVASASGGNPNLGGPGGPNVGGPTIVNPNVGPGDGINPGIAGPNFGTSNDGAPDSAVPSIGAPAIGFPGDFPNGGPPRQANPGPFINPNPQTFGAISNPHLGPSPGVKSDSAAPGSRNVNPPADNTHLVISSNGKLDPLQPFGLTPLLTVVPTSNNTQAAAPSRQAPSFVPGIVEQVPLENEGQAGVIGANRPPPNRGVPRPDDGSADGRNIGVGPTDFSWTWAPAQPGQGPPKEVPSWAFPNPAPPNPPSAPAGSQSGPSSSSSFSVSAPVSVASSDSSSSTPVLPPDVITASVPVLTNTRPSSGSHTPPSTRRRPSLTDDDLSNGLPPELKTVPPKKHRPDDELGGGSDAAAAAGEIDPNSGSASGANATTTIAVCLTVVVVVMISVFITLCVVRHRNRANSRQSVSSASRTSAYVAAQAARMNYAASTYGVVGPNGSGMGTGAYMREVGPNRPGNMGTLQRGGSAAAANGNQTWIYAPGTYASPSTYYK